MNATIEAGTTYHSGAPDVQSVVFSVLLIYVCPFSFALSVLELQLLITSLLSSNLSFYSYLPYTISTRNILSGYFIKRNHKKLQVLL